MPQEKQTLSWLRVALFSFIVAALLGATLRLAFIVELPDWLPYRNLQHAHSHVAMMGWLYSGLYIFIIYLYKLDRPVYRKLFWLTQLTVLGMLLSFPVQGYGPVSITFTTAHMLLSYAFIYQVLQDLKGKPEVLSTLFLKTSLLFLFISTIGTWALVPIMNSSLKSTALYYGAVQFFLHFQFNGWFIFGVIALFFKTTESAGIIIDDKLSKPFYRLLVISCFLTYALAVTWSTPLDLIFYANSTGVLLQLIALYFLYRIIQSSKKELSKKLKKFTWTLWTFALLCLALKILMQSAVSIPSIATISYTIRNFVVGFVHLLMLGCLSTFFIGLISEHFSSPKSRIGVYLFLAGILFSEILLFLQGLMFWMGMGFISNYYYLIFGASTLIPLGLIIYFLQLTAIKNSRID